MGYELEMDEVHEERRSIFTAAANSLKNVVTAIRDLDIEEEDLIVPVPAHGASPALALEK